MNAWECSGSNHISYTNSLRLITCCAHPCLKYTIMNMNPHTATVFGLPSRLFLLLCILASGLINVSLASRLETRFENFKQVSLYAVYRVVKGESLEEYATKLRDGVSKYCDDCSVTVQQKGGMGIPQIIAESTFISDDEDFDKYRFVVRPTDSSIPVSPTINNFPKDPRFNMFVPYLRVQFY